MPAGIGPVTVLEYLGVYLDSVDMKAYLPIEKISRIITMIDAFRHRRRITKRELLSLLGHMNFASRVIRPDRSFVSYLLSLAASVSGLHYHVYLIKPACGICQCGMISCRSGMECHSFMMKM